LRSNAYIQLGYEVTLVNRTVDGWRLVLDINELIQVVRDSAMKLVMKSVTGEERHVGSVQYRKNDVYDPKPGPPRLQIAIGRDGEGATILNKNVTF
jgi:hypothetical protein